MSNSLRSFLLEANHTPKELQYIQIGYFNFDPVDYAEQEKILYEEIFPKIKNFSSSKKSSSISVSDIFLVYKLLCWLSHYQGKNFCSISGPELTKFYGFKKEAKVSSILEILQQNTLILILKQDLCHKQNLKEIIRKKLIIRVLTPQEVLDKVLEEGKPIEDLDIGNLKASLAPEKLEKDLELCLRICQRIPKLDKHFDKRKVAFYCAKYSTPVFQQALLDLEVLYTAYKIKGKTLNNVTELLEKLLQTEKSVKAIRAKKIDPRFAQGSALIPGVIRLISASELHLLKKTVVSFPNELWLRIEKDLSERIPAAAFKGIVKYIIPFGYLPLKKQSHHRSNEFFLLCPNLFAAQWVYKYAYIFILRTIRDRKIISLNSSKKISLVTGGTSEEQKNSKISRLNLLVCNEN